MNILNKIVVPETGETVLDNLCNAVSLMSLVKNPEPLAVDISVLTAVLNMLRRHHEGAAITLKALDDYGLSMQYLAMNPKIEHVTMPRRELVLMLGFLEELSNERK